MYNGLLHAHSGLRWLVLLFIVLAIVFALAKWIGKKPFWQTHKKIALLALVFTHLQVLFGLIMYFMSPKVKFEASSMKNAVSRFYLVEHLAGMLIAAILITLGYSLAKKSLPEVSAKKIFWYYLAALIVMLVSIPWPSRIPNAGWF